MFLLFCLVAGSALAEGGGVYVGVYGQASLLEDKTYDFTSDVLPDLSGSFGFDMGVGGGIDFGYRHSSGLRFELGVGFQQHDVTDFQIAGLVFSNVGEKLVNYHAMSRVYYDLYNSTKITPYIGAGAGMRRMKIRVTSDANTLFIDNGDAVFAYEVLAGLAYQLDKKARVYMGYKYHVIPEITFAGVINNNQYSIDDYFTSNIELGIQVAF